MSPTSKALGPRIVGRKQPNEILNYRRISKAIPPAISRKDQQSARRGAEGFKAQARFIAVCREADEQILA
jgi:hypothetical protein